MRKIAHIIHPCLPPAGSDLHVAQPITFATMQAASAFAQGQVDVKLYAVKQQDEVFDLPAGFTPTPDLTRAVCDLGNFRVKRKLALIRDILDQLYAAAGDADYLIYTNVDIALQPHFYLAVNALLNQGYDALIINPVAIPAAYQAVAELPLMYAQRGVHRHGYDCFVFRRAVYPDYHLGSICIGAIGIGAALGLNLLYHAANFKEFTDLQLTFHLGDERVWRAGPVQDYARHNVQEFRKILHQYRTVRPDFQHDFITTVETRLAQALGESPKIEQAKYRIPARIARRLGKLRRYWQRKAGQ